MPGIIHPATYTLQLSHAYTHARAPHPLPQPTFFTIFCSTPGPPSAMLSSRLSPRYRPGSWRASAPASRASHGASASPPSSLAPSSARLAAAQVPPPLPAPPPCCCWEEPRSAQASARLSCRSRSSIVREPTWACMGGWGGVGWRVGVAARTLRPTVDGWHGPARHTTPRALQPELPPWPAARAPLAGGSAHKRRPAG